MREHFVVLFRNTRTAEQSGMTVQAYGEVHAKLLGACWFPFPWEYIGCVPEAILPTEYDYRELTLRH